MHAQVRMEVKQESIIPDWLKKIISGHIVKDTNMNLNWRNSFLIIESFNLPVLVIKDIFYKNSE